MYQGLSLVHVKQQFDMCPAYQLSYTMMSIINFEQWLYLSLKMDIYFTWNKSIEVLGENCLFPVIQIETPIVFWS